MQALDFRAKQIHRRSDPPDAGTEHLEDVSLDKEVTGSLSKTAALSGRACRSFAYPNGRPSDYDHRCLRILAEHGIVVAVTTTEGSNRMGAAPLQLRRYGIGPAMNRTRFAAIANGLPVAGITSFVRRVVGK